MAGPVGGKVIGGVRRPAQKGQAAGPARVTVTPLQRKTTTAKDPALVRAAGGRGSRKAER
jgi:hypothetical protein